MDLAQKNGFGQDTKVEPQIKSQSKHVSSTVVLFWSPHLRKNGVEAKKGNQNN